MFIGNDAANKMRAGTVQGVHQSSQLFLNEDMDTVSLQEPYMYFHYEGPLGYMFPTQPFFVLSYNAALRDETKWLQGRLMLRQTITNFIQEQMIIPCVCCLQSGNCHLFLLHELWIKTC